MKNRKPPSVQPVVHVMNAPDEILNTLWLWSLALASHDVVTTAFVQIDLGSWTPAYRPYARA